MHKWRQAQRRGDKLKRCLFENGSFHCWCLRIGGARGEQNGTLEGGKEEYLPARFKSMKSSLVLNIKMCLDCD